MNSVEVYIKIQANKILDISDVQQEDDFWEKIEVNTRDDFEVEMQNRNIEIDFEDIQEKILIVFDDDDDQAEIEDYQIKHRVVNRSFGELVDMYLSKEINIPEMQRKYVWDSKKSSRLIESIILGLPIPPLFFMEISDNKYEVIDGVQRLTTIVNYMEGNSWTGNSSPAAKLTKDVAKGIRGKKFEELNSEYQRKIRRSTVPLIEFSQASPGNHNSKYLIFERINTGSEKLNPMQIRKSLSYGPFIQSVYDAANSSECLAKIFTQDALRKDKHVEAFLRVYVMRKIAKQDQSVNGIKEILNKYCEENKEQKISQEFIRDFNKYMQILIGEIFEEGAAFRRYIKEDSTYKIIGNINVSIMEAVMGILIDTKPSKINNEDFLSNYKEILSNYGEKSNENPFTTSTGTHTNIKLRFEEAQKMLEI